MYEIVKIIDSNSDLKSDFAKYICEKILCDKYAIEYVQKMYGEGLRCENNIVRKRKIKGKEGYKFIDRKKRCNMKIADIFILRNIDNNSLIRIGNNCIQVFFENDLLSNILKKDLHFIQKTLRANTPCILCEINTKKGYHKKCVNGESSNCFINQDLILQKKHISVEIQISFYLRKLIDIMPNNVLLCRTQYGLRNYSIRHPSRTIDALKYLYNNSELLINNKEKLLVLENNVIIKSIRTQRRPPTIKQMAILEKIICDYDRIRIIDRENKNEKYKLYGYVFKSRW